MAHLTNKDASPSLQAASPLRPGLIGDARVIAAGYHPRKAQWIDRPFSFPAVGMIVSGRGHYRVGQGPWQSVEPGSMFTVYPGPPFHYGAGEGGTWEEYYLCLKGERVDRWCEAGLLPTDGKVRRLVEVDSLVERFRELLRMLQRGRMGDGDRTVLLAEQLLLELYYSRASVHREKTPEPGLRAALDHCRQHLDERIDFRALAREHGMSYSLLRQRIRKVTGLPPARYLTHLRCEAARTLLSDTDASVQQIASQVGIADPYVFSRTFKRCVGLSPRQYRLQAAPWAQAQ